MCLAVPVKVIEIKDDSMVMVEKDGVTLNASSILLPTIAIGDYVLLHAGFAIEKISTQEANEKFMLMEEYYQKTGERIKG
ncbi:MAG: HypC/HybG/HupF family hydrogenase formation chaperone [Bdellovibrionales bacterium]|jgi:hydrogenase expression/formation protein HypC|nr:HypC/HybG/HupF family hydrogenase formation chaperone [Bdellovibrionales bacterium]MBT3526150.1 HypC/HybG/HupF family hydrogenase formation chaperone [Bdellovibrionales bacterium]MBT7668839.1 HypC/HybG/HupF family hydrogenase formation chaperone [Bdellovibrionales bacterium]MBT7767464.1 HypC/HybG/HupF family hydrogenase formation chaperone [Bdellovibrionales bacterium]